MKILLIMLLMILPFFKVVRCAICNIHYVYFYTVKDLYYYFKEKKWKYFTEYGIDMYVGMFGHGKTLSMVHKARNLYKLYGDSIDFISNFELKGIPYTPLVNFNQLVDLGEDLAPGKQGTVVLIDEISSVLSLGSTHNIYMTFSLLTEQPNQFKWKACIISMR